MKNYYNINELEVGIDESGLGSTIGSVFIGAVILPPECPNIDEINLWDKINDSKKISKKDRFIIEEYIKKVCIDYSVFKVSKERIDLLNILNARLEGYHKVLDNMILEPSLILVDGNKMNNYKNIKHLCIIKGDTKYKSIAAASILAKTAKDREVKELHEEYNMYNWVNNCGYLTKQHYQFIEEYGLTKYHRKWKNVLKITNKKN